MPEDNKSPQKPSLPAALVGLTKRQQVEKTNKNIFIWVAVASVVLALSAVTLQFLVREALFNGKVISEQEKTSKTLEENKKNFVSLKREIDALLADDSLAALRVNPNDSALQVILDALPTNGDSTSFSNSMYNKILSRQGVSIAGVSVGGASVAAAVPGATPAVPAATGATATPQILTFQASIAGSPDQIRAALLDIEKVIRPMAVRQISITAGGGQLEVSLQGDTYYLPRSTVALGKKTIKP